MIQLQLKSQGAMAPFTGQIRTSQEKNPCQTDLSDSTYRWQRQYVEHFEETEVSAESLDWLQVTLVRVCSVNSRLGNVTVSLCWASCPKIAMKKSAGSGHFSQSAWTHIVFLLECSFVAAFVCLLQPYLPVYSSNTHACKHKYIHYICSILHT